MRNQEIVIKVIKSDIEIETIPFEDEEEYNTDEIYTELIKKYCNVKDVVITRESIYLNDKWVSCVGILSVEDLSREFSKAINEWLSKEEIDEVNIRNEEHLKLNDGICATHDFCDANMAMVQALNDLDIIWEMNDEVQGKIIDQAWVLSKKNKFSITK